MIIDKLTYYNSRKRKIILISRHRTSRQPFMKIFFILLPLLFITSNIYVFCKAWSTLSNMPAVVKAAGCTLFWCSAFAFIATMFLSDSNLSPALLSGLHTYGGLWIIFVIFTAVGCLFSDIVNVFVRMPKNTCLYAMAIALLLTAYGFINHTNPRVVTIDIESEKPLNEDLKMVVISDLHLGYGTGRYMLQRFTEKINALSPDIIIIAGDLIDNSVKPVKDAHMHEILSRLHAKQGIFMVPGNHEYISGIENCYDFIEQTPIRMLRDSVLSLPCGVELIMRDDLCNKHRMRLKKLCSKADSSKFTILIEHQPLKIDKKNSMKIDMQISGHTHNGQVWPGNLIVNNLYEQAQGYRKWEHSHVWVSSGLSLWGPPVRIGTRGDIAIINIKNSNREDRG